MKMKHDLKRLEIACMSPMERFFTLPTGKGQKLTLGGTKGNEYVYIQTGASILALGHLDTVSHLPVQFSLAPSKTGKENSKEFAWSPQLDDRAGIYTLLYYLPRWNLKYDLLLTTGEETGQSSAKLFQTTVKYNWMFEFDRRGTDVVMYSYGEGSKFGSEFFKPLLGLFGLEYGIGSYSDIEALTRLEITGFNIGTGYQQEHTPNCYLDLDDLTSQCEKFAAFYEKFKDIPLPYEPKYPAYNQGVTRTTYPGGAYAESGLRDRWEMDDYYPTDLPPANKTLDTPPAGRLSRKALRSATQRWKTSSWECDCASNYFKAAHVNKCFICGLTKTQWIEIREETGQAATSTASPSTTIGATLADLRLVIREVMGIELNSPAYLDKMLTFLTSWKASPLTPEATYVRRLRTRRAAISPEYLTHDEVVLLLQPDGGTYEFLDGRLTLGFDKGILKAYKLIALTDKTDFNLKKRVFANLRSCAFNMDWKGWGEFMSILESSDGTFDEQELENMTLALVSGMSWEEVIGWDEKAKTTEITNADIVNAATAPAATSTLESLPSVVRAEARP